MSCPSAPNAEGPPPINEANKRQTVVVRSRKDSPGCQLTQAMAGDQAQELIVILGVGDMFMQSLILALVYLPGIRAPPRSRSQPGGGRFSER